MTNRNLFISYSHVDQNFAKKLASMLADEGLNIWIDVEDIPAGENWRNAIDEGLKTAEIMLLIVSPESMASAEVQAEWNYFLDERKTVIPIQLRQADIPSRLRLIQRVDFSKESTVFEEDYARLRDRLMGADAALNTVAKKAPIKSVHPETPSHQPSPKDNSANRTQIMVAIIGTVGVIIAAVIGLLPTFLNRAAPVDSATSTATSKATQSLAATTATSPSATSTPTVPVGTYKTTVIYNGADSLVVRAEAASNLSGLVLRSVNEDITLTEYFPALEQVGNVINPGQCLVFFRDGEEPPPPRGCRETLEYKSPRGETFWYDNNANRARDLAKVRDGAVLGICSSGGGAGSCDFSSS